MEYDHVNAPTSDFEESSTTKLSPNLFGSPCESLSTTGSVPSLRVEVSGVVPVRLGHYEIQGAIGKGGMGTVYRAEHVFLRRHFAVKVVNSRLLDDETVSGYFATEMLMMGSLQHPNIVQTTDAGDENGRRYIVMELLDGSDLSKYIKETGPLPIGVALDYLRQAASGLEAAHRIGIVHRDVKPSNLFLCYHSSDQRMRVHSTSGSSDYPSGFGLKLLDLGLAKCMCQKDDVHDGHFVGSPGFTAPEQISGGESDARSDMYSLGCTFYYMLTGHAPFESPQYPNVKSILDAQLTKDFPPLETHRDDLNRNAKDLIARMTCKNPNDRFQSMSELIAALDMPKDYISRRKKVDRPSRTCRFVFAVSSLLVLIAATVFSFSLPVLESFGKCTTQACKNRTNVKLKRPPVENGCSSSDCNDLLLCLADKCREKTLRVCEHYCNISTSSDEDEKSR